MKCSNETIRPVLQTEYKILTEQNTKMIPILGRGKAILFGN